MATDYAHLLGRLEERKPEQERFPLRAIARPTAPTRTRRMWRLGRMFDQRQTSDCLVAGNCGSCVGHAFAHLLGASPVRIKDPRGPMAIYRRAQERWDPWEGSFPAYSGTSVDAGAQTLLEWGLIESFHWAWTLEDVVAFVLEVGPIVLGTSWFEGMGDPDAQHVMRATGRNLGGHAYLLRGVDTKAGMAHIANSWGLGWADRGKARLPFEDLEILLRDGGEACAVKERAS